MQIKLKTIEKALGFFDSTVSIRENILRNIKLIATPSE
jgi:hypothetical protein